MLDDQCGRDHEKYHDARRNSQGQFEKALNPRSIAKKGEQVVIALHMHVMNCEQLELHPAGFMGRWKDSIVLLAFIQC
jgi:hypothetical protein